MSGRPSRRAVLGGAAAAAAASALPAGGRAWRREEDRRPHGRFRFAVKGDMVAGDAPLADHLALLARLGYDGVELASPGPHAGEEVLSAVRASGLPVHGVVDSVHWQVRLSDRNPAVRARALEALRTAIRDAHAFGGHSVLLVPGVVKGADETHEDVWRRSIEGIRSALPLAAALGVRVLVENVWNGFGYDPEGGDDQTPELLVRYLDEIASPWVGMYLDLGNHRRFGRAEEWIRALGPRIVKLDVKDWSREGGFERRIGAGDVDWPAVRKALADVGFAGWCTAEVAGGGEERLAEVLSDLRAALLG